MIYDGNTTGKCLEILMGKARPYDLRWGNDLWAQGHGTVTSSPDGVLEIFPPVAGQADPEMREIPPERDLLCNAKKRAIRDIGKFSRNPICDINLKRWPARFQEIWSGRTEWPHFRELD